MSTCPNCGDSFKPMNSDHRPFCGERCQDDYAMGFDAAEQRINELEGQNAKLSARVAELTAEVAELRCVTPTKWRIDPIVDDETGVRYDINT